MKRRDALRSLSMAGGASLLSTTKHQLSQALSPEIPSGLLHPGFAQAVPGTAPVKIRDIKTILTAPNRIRLVDRQGRDDRAGPRTGWAAPRSRSARSSCRRRSSSTSSRS